MLPYICIRVNTYASFRQRRQKRSPSPRQIAARCCIIAAYQRRIPPLRAFLRRFARPAFFNTTLLSENDAEPATLESHLYLYAIPVPDSESRTIPNHSSEDEKPPREQAYRALGGTYSGGRHAPRRQNQPTAARSGLHWNANEAKGPGHAKGKLLDSSPRSPPSDSRTQIQPPPHVIFAGTFSTPVRP